MDFKGYSFQHQGEKRDHLTFGDDFLPELERVVAAHSPSGSKYLEWGAGLSTLLLTDLASRCLGIVVSVEHNQEYADSVLSHVRHPATLQLFAVDLNGPRLSQADTGLNYSTLPLSLGMDFDFVLIDGRRRLECAYSAFVLASPTTVVALHDYRRVRYQAVTALYDVVEDGSHFRVMRPNPVLLAASNDRRRRLLASYAVPPNPSLQRTPPG